MGSPKVYTIDIAELCSPDLKPTDKVAFQELDIATYGGTRFVQCKDGNIYTVETTKDGKNNLVRINADFSLKKVAMRDDYSPPRSVLTEKPVSAALLKEYSTTSQEERYTKPLLTIPPLRRH